MGMVIELVLLSGLIIIFIASFCGLLQKIRRTYEQDREYTARMTNVSSPQLSLTEIYINPTFTENTENHSVSQGVFPCAPPPYTEVYCEPPPKYEDIIKNRDFRVPVHVSN
ncbi:uncharacterized protein LOC123010632 [Tribolium madens]|uniref:uncharacterized protein LOC123010632 n=1 Tax=Tribolium madens TaxID=41895 RepID=UPI001CF73A76|nr:uncharacterized protein LOC123010632 [Tribolium madens]